MITAKQAGVLELVSEVADSEIESPRSMQHIISNVRLRKIFLVVMLLFLSAFILSGCKKENASAYKVVDSGIWTYGEPVEKTFWLDSERVLVVSNKTLAPGGAGPKVMTIWNTKTGEINFSHPLTSLICVQNGQVLFFATKDEATDTRIHYRGTLDDPQEYLAPSPNMRIDDRFDCSWVPKSTYGRFSHLNKLRGRNYMESVESKTSILKGKSVYYQQLGDKGKEMPFHLPSYNISYSEFLDAYVIDKRIFDPANPEMRAFWILERNGNLKKVPFPQRMLKGNLTVYPLKQGYLAHYNSGKYTTTDPGNRGLWLLDGDKVLRLIVGSIHGISVSPDGCHAAFSHARNIKELFSQKKPYKTVKTINFCKESKQQ